MAWQFLKRLTQSDSILQSLRPLAYISLIGLAPFRMSANKEVRTSVCSFAAGIVHFCFFVLCFFLSRHEGDSIISYFFQTSITRLGDATLSLSGIIAMVTIFSSIFFKRNLLLNIIQNCLVVDDIFLRLGLKLDYRKILLYSFVTSMGLLLFNAVYLLVSYMLLRSAEIWPSFVVFTTFALPHLNISIMVFKFLCTTHLTRTRFRMMNEVLQDILDSHIEERDAIELSPMHSVIRIVRRHSIPRRHVAAVIQPTITPRPRYSVTSIVRENPETALKQVSHVHNLLCDICCTIEDYFNYPMLAIIAISFLFILFDDFYILEAIIIPSRVDKFEADEFFAFFFTQMVWYVVIILLIVEGSSKTIRESNRTAAIVHKILNISDDSAVQDRLLRFSLQLSHRRVAFTAAGLFNLDRTLIFTICGAATCYLIILIQFRSTPSHWERTNASSAAVPASG
ncbi:putative gustatory receptor 28a [Rhagoletis pomonella]|uniref:putative gustatory receptor 28a n=1 Tax=Rhagoletis pomonella TaxID=28610 RepID=UPI0017862AA0|nr:putative gustatory receptor 28a [Rhagoletis pomonella]